jgi:hypothetical protein
LAVFVSRDAGKNAQYSAEAGRAKARRSATSPIGQQRPATSNSSKQLTIGKIQMKLTIKTPNALLLAAIMVVMAAFNASALPPGKTGEWKPIDSPKEAKALPEKAKIMLACAGCKTIRPLDKKGIMAWFSTKVRHDCPACGGKLRFTGAVPGKSSGSPTKYVHICSHCGDVSAYVCASH